MRYQKPRLILLDHPYHKKTRSTYFLDEILTRDFEVRRIFIDRDSLAETERILSASGKLVCDVIVIFQAIIPREVLERYITFRTGVIIPMYDDPELKTKARLRCEYQDFQIICFSRSDYITFLHKGFLARYIQYFPQPQNIEDNYGQITSIYFWNRVNSVNLETLRQTTQNLNLKEIIWHKAIDPHNVHSERPDFGPEVKIEETEWSQDVTSVYKRMLGSAFYFAPRNQEGIGMSFLNAMAMGRCVIAVDNPTMNEYIEDGETGLLYSLSDPLPIYVDNIRTIQKNTLAYIQKGYDNWLSYKGCIASWLKQDLSLYEDCVSSKAKLTLILIDKEISGNAFIEKALLQIDKIKSQKGICLDKVILLLSSDRERISDKLKRKRTDVDINCYEGKKLFELFKIVSTDYFCVLSSCFPVNDPEYILGAIRQIRRMDASVAIPNFLIDKNSELNFELLDFLPFGIMPNIDGIVVRRSEVSDDYISEVEKYPELEITAWLFYLIREKRRIVPFKVKSVVLDHYCSLSGNHPRKRYLYPRLVKKFLCNNLTYSECEYLYQCWQKQCEGRLFSEIICKLSDGYWRKAFAEMVIPNLSTHDFSYVTLRHFIRFCTFYLCQKIMKKIFKRDVDLGLRCGIRYALYLLGKNLRYKVLSWSYMCVPIFYNLNDREFIDRIRKQKHPANLIDKKSC